MITLQFTNIVLSLLSTYFFISIIKKNKNLEKALDKTLLKVNSQVITYTIPTSIILFVFSFIISIWGKYGLPIIQLFSLLGILEIMLMQRKDKGLKGDLNLDSLNTKVELDEVRSKFLDFHNKQEKIRGEIAMLQKEISSVDFNLKDEFMEFSEEYKKEIVDINQNIKLLTEAILELNTSLKPQDSNKSKVEKPEIYMDPYIKAYLEG